MSTPSYRLFMLCQSCGPDLSSEISSLSPISRSLLTTLSRLQSVKSPLDPSPFLTTLENAIVKSGNKEFKVNMQQDAPEILGVIVRK